MSLFEQQLFKNHSCCQDSNADPPFMKRRSEAHLRAPVSGLGRSGLWLERKARLCLLHSSSGHHTNRCGLSPVRILGAMPNPPLQKGSIRLRLGVDDQANLRIRILVLIAAVTVTTGVVDWATFREVNNSGPLEASFRSVG
jgi:hypothetical protein